MSYRKLLLLIGVLICVFGFYLIGGDSYFSFEAIKARQAELDLYYQKNVSLSRFVYFLIYVVVTALSLPGAAVLTLLGGAVFGLLWGLLLVSFASTIGATLAFLLSRYIFRSSVERRFGDRLQRINRGIDREGPFYLFTLRLIPLIPFFVINVVMGLTRMSPAAFYVVSQIGMLPGTFVYVNAGRQLSTIENLSDIFNPTILLSFALIGILPLVMRAVIRLIRRREVFKKYRVPEQFDYNVAVIGGGAAGLVTSYIAAAVKAKPALFERSKMGGDCLNYGCVPSKAIIKSARVAYQMRGAEKYGIKGVEPEVDFAQVMERVQNVITDIEPHDSVERYTKLGVACHQGEAHIRSPFEIECNGETFTTKNIVVATGGRPRLPNIPGLSDAPYYTSETVWNLREKPNRLLVLGGGPIGVELAHAFVRLEIETTLVERAERILQREDEDIASYVADQMRDDGVVFRFGHEVAEFIVENGNHFAILNEAASEERVPFDAVFIALGREANTSGLGLEELGIELRADGTIEVDDELRTNIPNIFCCGDVTGPLQFTHFAAHQAWFCAVNALFGRFKSFKVDYRVIPRCTFTDPEIAAVGVNETSANEQGIAYELVTYDVSDLDRAIAESEAHGLVKVLVRPGTDKILGVTIVGARAGDYIAEFVLAMKERVGLSKILGTVHAYPTFAEANKYAAGEWKKQNQPFKLLSYLKRLHAWERGEGF